MVQVSVGLHAGDGGVEGLGPRAARGEDEAELFGGKCVADDFEFFGVGADVAAAGGGVDEDEVDVAGDECLDGGAEAVEQADARVGLVAVEDVVDSGVEACRAGLGADEELFVGGEGTGRVEAVFAGAHEHELLAGHVGVGEVDDLGAFGSDGDAVHADVELFVGDGLDHGFPGGDLPVDDAVEAAADFVDGVVFPADGLAAGGVDEVEGDVVVAGNGDKLGAVHVRQLVVDDVCHSSCGAVTCLRAATGRLLRRRGGNAGAQRQRQQHEGGKSSDCVA